MSTDLNTNNSSQTLFRFAAMRNPELSDPKNKKRRFVFRKEIHKGVFDEHISTDKTLQAVCRRIDEQQLITMYSEDNLISINPAFHDLAVWVARNKSTVSKTEFDTKINDYKASNTFPYIADMKLIWDNLIYQVVTQKDFYAKETLMQFLHVNHILENYDGTEEAFEDLRKAKVVLPKELFTIPSTNSTGISTNYSQRTTFNSTAMKFAEATQQLKETQKLADSISKLEKKYRTQYDEAQKSAYNDYQRNIKPLLREIQKEATEADRRKQILENRINYLTQLSVADPEKFYANSELEMELHRIKEEIMEITVSDTEIPEFEFNYETPQIDPSEIGRALGQQEQNALCRVFGTSTVAQALSGISTFQELHDNIHQNNQVLQQTILNNTVINHQVSAKVGGVVIPVTANSSSSGYIPFSIKTFARSATEWSLILAFNDHIDLISAQYKATVNNTEISSTSFSSLGGGSYLLFDIPKILVSQTTVVEQFVVEGKFTSANGTVYDFNVTLFVDPNDLDRMTKQYHFRGADGCLPPENPPKGNPGETENPPVDPTIETFIPSGFGMKNIGVADYLKVEQSTYCYVEGDVAHIENIMAREYKERATRRLKRSESQTTKSSESEKEKLTDTTTTERHEMQSEISKILQESKDFSAQAGAYANWGMGDNKFGITANASYATHNSKEESNRQAVTEAKDITARALDRIVTKVKEERIDKILEEYEENNKHGFDNTKGSNHVVGVYRWVDKVVKNQIYNYGKRMMFEFMIPEPAKLHNLGIKMIDESEKLVKPVDPRESLINKMENFISISDSLLGDTVLKYWISKYNVEIDKKPEDIIYVGKSFSYKAPEPKGNPWELAAESTDIEIPMGYKTVSALAVTGDSDDRFDSHNPIWSDAKVLVGNTLVGNVYTPINSFIGKIPISYSQLGLLVSSVNISIQCQLTQDAKDTWYQKTFNKIIEAYEIELDKYNQALAEAKALGVQIKGSNPGFYRKIENTILRKNCISYMISQNPFTELTFGKRKYHNNGFTSGAETFLNTDIKVDSSLDQYAAFVKFMEQAFEWDIMSYYFYPFYWGDRNKWSDMYQFDDNDPTFRAFMQSGMARVIVTVRPGFEEAVRHFMATGQIWSGGEVPVIDDPLFLSIVDEMRAAVGKKQGEPWREKIPTSLTILQADSIGLKVEKALPCHCEPGVKFDDQLGEMCTTNFELNNNQIGQSGDKWIEISFDEMDNFTTIEEVDAVNAFPRKYRCLGNEITVDRDATWQPSDSLAVIYKALSDELSQIEGLETFSMKRGIAFKINISKIKNFTFTKPGGHDSLGGHDVFKFSVDFDTSTLKIHSPEYGNYGGERILDKNGQVIPPAEYLDKVPLSKFLI
ncbi:coiled-coil domain-containing protein [Chryseobacterium binzhouense]|uniref:hypothetical protein n=1 Tax=Chryseobacterium binzhouense TaxID=2593646 RepID=UPI0016274066|nr:hypothetical protein [Chryseobacterium binzhouense]